MNYNFDTEYINYQFDTSVNETAHFPNPCDYICGSIEIPSRPRTSVNSMQQRQEITSSIHQIDGHDENLELKKILSSHSMENMFNEQEEKLCDAEHKFELSEQHHYVPEEINCGLEMGSYLREHVTNAAISGEARTSRSGSDSILEQNSPIDYDISNEESSSENLLSYKYEEFLDESSLSWSDPDDV